MNYSEGGGEGGGVCVCGGGGGGQGHVCVYGREGSLSYLYRIPTLALKYIYLFSPFGGLLTRLLIIMGNK